jgi:L-threonylcarbamoyladenylate synthase
MEQVISRFRSPLSESDIQSVVQRILQGDVFVHGAETLYGIGGSVENKALLDTIREIKQRPATSPFILLTSNPAANQKYFQMGKNATTLANKYWPGAVTFVLNATDHTPEYLIREGTIAVRVPGRQELLQILSHAGPIVSTSANLSGQPPFRTLEPILDLVTPYANHITAIDYGDFNESPGSTIVNFSNDDNPRILRQGTVQIEEIQSK